MASTTLYAQINICSSGRMVLVGECNHNLVFFSRVILPDLENDTLMSYMSVSFLRSGKITREKILTF